MPKEETKKTSGKRVANLLILTDGKKSIIVPSPQSYEDAVRAAARHFGGQSTGYALRTRDLDICDGAYVDISPDAWELVKPELKTLRVVPVDCMASTSLSTTPSATLLSINALPRLASAAAPPPMLHPTAPTASGAQNIVLHFNRGGATETIRIKRTIPLEKAFAAVSKIWDVQYCSHSLDYWPDDAKPEVNFTWNGIRLTPTDTVDSVGLEDGDTVDVWNVQKGGKPVVYLYSPRTVEATVRLSLVPEWNFSVVYPVVPVKSTGAGQGLEWRVQTQQDGTLRELTTGLEVAYLYWEAKTDGVGTISPPSSPTLATPTAMGEEVFRPNLSGLSDEDSVVLPVSTVTPYLDTALAALGLHTEARTSFITYWLPSMLKHEHVALRFVEQAAYERAAPLDITPVPDVVTRVFMLFRGVADAELNAWPAAQLRAKEPALRWQDVVGVQLATTLDTSLFRVIEWGGMEVLH
ncbi:hypothetical protein K523DRAFT_269933 [Schizophyllum commune Tattone D]|nr:hypothetical protein K523DRAFT_269933 [Schizophyllum commune Tattone D]